MLIQGFPISAKLPPDLRGADRFWYWRGASGRSYIHSIYSGDACPPLPGAVYVAVRRSGHERHAVAVGRFAAFWDGSIDGLATAAMELHRADEIHVHLLARDEREARDVLADLAKAFDEAGSDAQAERSSSRVLELA